MHVLKYAKVIVGWQILRDAISFLLMLKVAKSSSLVWSGTCFHLVGRACTKVMLFFFFFLFCMKF